MPVSSISGRGDRRLPRGRHNLPRAFVASNQRERIIDALATVCAAKGYRAATVEDIIAVAGVSRRTFYDLFTSKQQCFLIAYELVMERALAAVERAFHARAGDWPQRMTRVFRTLFSLFVAEPTLARLVMVEVLAAGRTARAYRDAALGRFEVLFDPVRGRLPLATPDRALVDRAVIGGLAEALYTRIAAGDGDQLVDIGPDLLYCVLVPYVGHGQAMSASAAWRGESSPAGAGG